MAEFRESRKNKSWQSWIYYPFYLSIGLESTHLEGQNCNFSKVMSKCQHEHNFKISITKNENMSVKTRWPKTPEVGARRQQNVKTSHKRGRDHTKDEEFALDVAWNKLSITISKNSKLAIIATTRQKQQIIATAVLWQTRR